MAGKWRKKLKCRGGVFWGIPEKSLKQGYRGGIAVIRASTPPPLYPTPTGIPPPLPPILGLLLGTPIEAPIWVPPILGLLLGTPLDPLDPPYTRAITGVPY